MFMPVEVISLFSIYKFTFGYSRNSFSKTSLGSLKKIPYGETCTYKDVANQINKPKSVRAVGNACGANPVALIVPCHRVVKNDGSLSGYRWGIERKKKLLNLESYEFKF